MTKLTNDEIQERLTRRPGWELTKEGKISRNYQFKDYREATLFLGAVSYLAETMNHHPDISISWNKVKLEIVTHDAGGLTENDFALATRISDLPPLEN